MNPASKLRNAVLSLVICSAVLTSAPAWAAEEAPRLLPFQGRLTDPNGVPVTNGLKMVQFKIYDQPSAGQTVWAGEIHRVSINGGLVNVLLGTKSPLPTATASAESPFNRPMYLEITVDISGDNVITAADPPMLPRQVILPAPFAKEADNSRRFGGVTADDFQANDARRLGGYSAPEILAGTVPVGAILPYFGETNQLARNWKLCDGSIVADPTSSWNGRAVPDLREKFLRGVGGTNTVGVIGGQDNLPAHTHSFTDTASVEFIYNRRDGYVIADSHNFLGPLPDEVNVSGTTGSGGAHDNRPRFISVQYIIRIR